MATLTATEKAQLKDRGYSPSDLKEITSAIKKTTYTLILSSGDQQDLTEKEAISKLGREEWLKGIARSAFYTETRRYGKKGECIRIHSRIWTT